ncbi:MAG: hypothetical protein LBC98_08790 [Prevotellaceae bacterium]|nr:hypothetical protein [Prevotellaceae bacterium]
MMNYSTSAVKLLAILILFAQTALAQKNDREKMNLKGKVKTVMQIEYKIGEDTEDEARMKYVFNSKGYKTAEISEDREGNSIYRNDFAYDKTGRLISETETDNLINYVMVKSYKYNSLGKIEQIKVEAKKDLLQTFVYEYSDGGNTRNIKLLKKKGMTDENFIQKYDANENMIEEIRTEGNEYKKFVYLYDEMNRLIAKEEYNKSDRLRYKTEYAYDMFGNVITETSGYVGGTASPTVFTYVYQYDEHGNWTNVREQSEGKTFNVISRRIEY